MDLLVLMILNRFCKYAATYLRIFFSAALGALWSVAVLLIPKEYKMLANISTYIFVSMLMVKICAGKCKFLEVVKGAVILYGIVFMFGGIMHFCYYYTRFGYYINEVFLKDRELILFIGISFLFLALIIKEWFIQKVYGDSFCKVCCVAAECRIEMKGYIDTGNVLTDPFIQKPVCIAEKHCFEPILNDINDCTKVELKYHVIPFRSLGCDSGMLEVITADTMYIYYGKKCMQVENALIGLTGQKLSSDSAYEFLVNAQILK